MTVLPDPGTEFGARVARRLADDRVVWFTVVDGAGTPQPAPVWFLWDPTSETVLVYSQHDAKRLSHLRERPRVALHLNCSPLGGDVVVLTGTARVGSEDPPVDRNPDYLAKYGERIREGWQDPENFASTYSVPVRIDVRRVRGL
jgi:PPOX class probable F420-dependent enzyme